MIYDLRFAIYSVGMLTLCSGLQFTNQASHPLSILIIYSLHTCRDTCQHLIRNGFKHIGKNGYRQMIPEDFHTVTFLTVNIRYVDHADIHTNIAYIGSALPVHQTIGAAVAQMAIQPVGITDRNGCDARRAHQMSLAAISHRILFGHITYLQNGGP